MSTEDHHDIGLAHLELSGEDVNVHGDYALHYDSETSSWYLINEEDIQALGRLLDAETEDAYLRWCDMCGSEQIDLESIAADLDEDTDLDALMRESGAAGDTATSFALRFLREELVEMIKQNAEIAAEGAAA